MAKHRPAHTSKKNQLVAYKAQSRYAKNKRAKLERHLRKFPNDEQANLALANVSANPRRKAPYSAIWSKQQVIKAQLLASVGLNGHVVLNRKKEEELKNQVIGYGAHHALDEPKKKKKEKITA